MALSLEIPIEDQTGICELYEKIFAFDGGIYDRMTLEDEGYSDKIHFIAYDNIKKEMHLISQNLAFAMFENLSLDLSKKEYTKIVKNISGDRLKDFAIANYYYITDYSLTFAHKSIYEYFLAEYIFNCINNAYITSNIEKTLAFLFKRGKLSEDILYYFDYKIEKHNVEIYYSIESSINNMVKNGMTYFLENQIEDILKTESNIFENLLYILDSYSIILDSEHYKKIEPSNQFFMQLSNSSNTKLNFKKTIWHNLSIEYGYYILNLCHSIIIKSRFENSTYTDSNFKNTIMQRCYLSYVLYCDTSFENSILEDTHFSHGYFIDCIFNYCTFNDLEIQFFDIWMSDFNNALLTDLKFEGCELNDGEYNDAILTNVKFEECKLDGEFFKNSTLKNINFNNVFMKRIYFRGAALIDVDFSNAELIQYDTITIDEKTSFENVTVDIEFVPIILKSTKKITNLTIVDKANDRKLTLEEYKELYSLD